MTFSLPAQPKRVPPRKDFEVGRGDSLHAIANTLWIPSCPFGQVVFMLSLRLAVTGVHSFTRHLQLPPCRVPKGQPSLPIALAVFMAAAGLPFSRVSAQSGCNVSCSMRGSGRTTWVGSAVLLSRCAQTKEELLHTLPHWTEPKPTWNIDWRSGNL